jgi:hypothetical protein
MLGPWRVSKDMENGTAEGSDEINASDVPVIFMEDAWGIHLE